MLTCTNSIGQNNLTTEEFAEKLSVIAQSNRLKILCYLSKQEKKQCICDVLEKLDMKRNLLSHHLIALQEAGFLASRKDGRKIFYAVNTAYYTQFREAIKCIFNI